MLIDQTSSPNIQKRSLVQIRVGDNGHLQFDQAECFCGVLTISQGVQLTGICELIFAVIFTIQIPDFLFIDGDFFFFLGKFRGYGRPLYFLALGAIASCLLVILLLFIGIWCRKPLLLVPHMIWQSAFILTSIVLTILVIIWAHRGELFAPSAIVLVIWMCIPAMIESWWFYNVICCYRLLRSNQKCARRWASAMRSRTHSTVQLYIAQCYDKGDAVFVDGEKT